MKTKMKIGIEIGIESIIEIEYSMYKYGNEMEIRI
jgi:hypothetical protein